MTKAQKAERDEARERLRVWVKPGDRLHTILRHVSRSGMLRVVQVVKLADQDVEAALGYNAALACGYPYDRQREGVRMGGCGMDMGFALVYEIGSALFGDGFACTGEGCPSNDHSNGDRSYRSHLTKSGRLTRRQDCHRCKGSGRASYRTFDESDEECRSCAGGGKVGPGHWHRDGGYALRQDWL